MSLTLQKLFEDELRRRGVAFSIDADSGRHALDIDGWQMLVSLENVRRDFAIDGDPGRVSRFIDAILASARCSDAPVSPDRLYWCLEPNDHETPAHYRVAFSDRVDRVLVHLSPDRRLISWVAPEMLAGLALSESAASDRAFDNLAQKLDEATLEVEDIDGVQLGFISTTVPFKSSLILAPNLRKVVGDKVAGP